MGKFVLCLRGNQALSEITIQQSQQFPCKLSGQNFCGKCQIKACHANIAIGQSNCLYLFYPEKTEFDKYDVMFALSLTEKQFRDGYGVSKTNVYAVVALFNILSRLRTNHKGPLKVDPLWEEQHKLFLKNSYLRFPEFNATIDDIELLLMNQDKLQLFLNQSTSLQFELHDLLGIDQAFLDQSNLLRQTPQIQGNQNDGLQSSP